MNTDDPFFRDVRVAWYLVLLDAVLMLSVMAVGCSDFFAIRQVNRTFRQYADYAEPLHHHASAVYLLLKDEMTHVWRLVACEDFSRMEREMKALSALHAEFMAEAESAAALEGGDPRTGGRFPRMIEEHKAFFREIERIAVLKKTELEKRREAEVIVSAFDAKRLSAVAILEDIVYTAETDMNRFEEQSKLLAQGGSSRWDDVPGILAETFDVRVPVVQGANKARSFLYEIQILFQEYVNERNPDKQRELQDLFGRLFDRYARQLRIMRKRLPDEGYQRDFAVLEREVAGMRGMADGEKGLIRVCGGLLQAKTAMEQGLQTLLALSDSGETAVRSVLTEVETLREKTRGMTDAAVLRAKMSAGAILVFSVLLSAVAAILSVRLFGYSTRSRQALLDAKRLAETMNRQKTIFLTNVSHELRTPLTGIVGYAELISQSGDINLMRLQGAEILNQSEHLVALVNDLLDTAKISAGMMELTPAGFDLPGMLRSVEATIRILAEKKGLKFNARFSSDLPRAIVSDPMRLRQVLLNLLGNAVQYTQEGSVSFDVRGGPDGPQAVALTFTIEDTGVGISAERLKKWFARFEEGDRDIRERHGGIGLGLNLSRELVKLMGGDIQVSTLPDRGSMFAFTLSFPVDAGFVPRAEPSAMPEIQAAGKGRKVLVVEDYPVTQDILRIHLESAGYKVAVVETGFGAIDAVAHRTFDLVVLDINLPDMDGLEVARRIRAAEATRAAGHIPILALAVALDEETHDGILASGVNELLPKPIRRGLFLKTVAQWATQTEKPVA